MKLIYIITLLVAAVIIYYFKNVRRVKINNATGFFILLNGILVLMMGEAIIVNMIDNYDGPHVFLATFPVRFLMPFVLIRFWRRSLKLRFAPIRFKVSFIWLTWAIYVVMLPIFLRDTPERIMAIYEPPVILRLLLIVHLAATAIILSKLIKYGRTHTDVSSPVKRIPILGLALYIASYVLAIVEMKSIWQADILSSSLLGFSVWVFWVAIQTDARILKTGKLAS